MEYIIKGLNDPTNWDLDLSRNRKKKKRKKKKKAKRSEKKLNTLQDAE